MGGVCPVIPANVRTAHNIPAGKGSNVPGSAGAVRRNPGVVGIVEVVVINEVVCAAGTEIDAVAAIDLSVPGDDIPVKRLSPEAVR